MAHNRSRDAAVRPCHQYEPAHAGEEEAHDLRYFPDPDLGAAGDFRRLGGGARLALPESDRSEPATWRSSG